MLFLQGFNMITIRGRQYEAAQFTDRDMIWLSNNLAASGGDYSQNEKNICTILRKIFPDLDPELTNGDVLRLHSAEVAGIMAKLADLLTHDEDFNESMKGLPSQDVPQLAFSGKPRYDRPQNHGNKYRKR